MLVLVGFSRFVRFSGFHLYLTNYSIKLIYMHIIRTGSMRRLKLCALFVVSTYISRVINENVRKMAKTKTLDFKFMMQMIYHLVGHEILNITLYFIFHFNVCFSRKWRKCSQNLEKRKFKNTNLRVKRYESRTKCHKSDTDKMPQNENRIRCHRIRMHQNCNNKSHNSVTKA